MIDSSNVLVTIDTKGSGATGLSASSTGGIGCNGGSTLGWFSVGGRAEGGGSGEDVTVDNAGGVTTELINSTAILAQSVGGGNLFRNQSGSTTASALTVGVGEAAGDGAGLSTTGDTNQTTKNAKLAINGVGTTLTIDNTGTITGQILKASSIDLLNRPGGLINAGPVFEVDNLTNQGTLAVGGVGPIAATRLTGNLIQKGSSVLVVDLAPSRAVHSNQGDQINVGGRADLDGQVAVNLLDTWQPVAGIHSVALVRADGGLSSSGLEVTRSAVAQYALNQSARGALRLSYEIHFANAGILAATNDNQDDIARHIHGIYRAQALDKDVARELIAIEDTARYSQVMNSLSAEIAVDNQIASLLSGIRFNDALLNCAERSADYRFYNQGQCGWLRLGGQRFERHETRDNLGFDEDSWQIAGGGQIDGENSTYVDLQPAIDITTEIETGDGLLIRPQLTLGITPFLGNSAPTVTGRFAAAPSNVAPFRASTDMDKTRFDVAAGVDIFARNKLMVHAEAFGSFSENSESYGGGLKLSMSF